MCVFFPAIVDCFVGKTYYNDEAHVTLTQQYSGRYTLPAFWRVSYFNVDLCIVLPWGSSEKHTILSGRGFVRKAGEEIPSIEERFSFDLNCT